MKKLALLALAAGATTLAPQTASAQVIINNGGGGFHHGGFGGGGNFFGGFAFGGFFHQPQFHVQNWQLYGFIQPQPHQRWVRYYDDAYLVDRRGYIHDRRQRIDWDRYGERWERDDRGIPHYADRGDYHPDERDYDYAEDERRYGGGHGGEWDYSAYGSDCANVCGAPAHGRYDDRYDDRGRYEDRYEDRRYVDHRPPPAPCGPSYGCGASGYGGYHGGYGGGTVIVTETTVTPMVTTTVTEEIVEEVVEERAVRRHRRPARRAVPVRHHRPAPPPRVIHPRGERG